MFFLPKFLGPSTRLSISYHTHRTKIVGIKCVLRRNNIDIEVLDAQS